MGIIRNVNLPFAARAARSPAGAELLTVRALWQRVDGLEDLFLQRFRERSIGKRGNFALT